MLFTRKNFLKKHLAIILFLLTCLTLLLLHHPAQASVGLMYFRAVPGSNFIKLEWETAQEFENLGFNLYRGLTEDFDDAQQLNSNLILAQGGATGAFYDWVDNNVESGTEYTYWLEDIDTSNNSTVHDPVTASTTGGSTIPTVPSPGGGNSTATPTPTRTPTRTPSPTVQAQSTAAPTRTPTRIPTATAQPQPTSSNPTATTAPQTQPTAASNNPTIQQPTATFPSVATAASEPVVEELTQTVPDNSVLSTTITTTVPTDSKATATPQSLVQAASSSPDQSQEDSAALSAQQIGQGGQESQETETVNQTGDADGPERSTLVVMALIISIVLLFAGGGGIILLLLNRTKQTRI